ncbi:MAG: MarR family transcriptional regulator [Terricaulis silvestris]
MKKTKASAEALLDLSVATIELYFRLEAATQAIAGFASAGGEWGVLRTLIRHGEQTVPEMARSRPVSRQHCQTICNNLADQGLIEFIENPRHKRSQLVRITKKGRARFEAMSEQFLVAAGAFAPHFEKEELATATDVLRRARELIVV